MKNHLIAGLEAIEDFTFFAIRVADIHWSEVSFAMAHNKGFPLIAHAE